MLWLLVDLAVGTVAVTVLLLAGYRLYRHARVLMRIAGAAGTRVGDATAALDALSASRDERQTTT